MKRLITFFIVVSIFSLIVCSGIADSNHLLWNIEWGHEPKEIVSILKEEKGIYSEVTTDKTVFGMRFAAVESSDKTDITILNYPVKSIYWRWMMSAEQAECNFDNSVNTDECFSDILSAMKTNFGDPTKIVLRIYSAGYTAWSDKTEDNYYDVVDLSGTDISEINFKGELSKYSYIDEKTYATLDVSFDNIECRYTLDDGVYSVRTSYGNNEYVEEYMDYPEPTHEEYHLTQYTDTGF